MPKRIQRKRTKGWRLPQNAKCVDRTSRWGNPYVVDEWAGPRLRSLWPDPDQLVWHARLMLDDQVSSVAESVQRFRFYALVRSCLDPEWLEPLRGFDLACFCAEDAEHCHADVLLDLVERHEH